MPAHGDLLRLLVARKAAETDTICVFELAHPQGAPLPPFSAGAHVDVHLPNSLVRQYSLCNHEADRHRYVIAVHKDPCSRGGSVALHEAVHQGDLLPVSAPRNAFPLGEVDRDPLLLAGGIGITPLLAMARRLAHREDPFALHYFARTRSAAAFVRELSGPSFRGKVLFHFDDEPAGRDALHSLFGMERPGRPIYVCGPGGFIDTVLRLARERGWHDGSLHCERFTAAPPVSGAGSFELAIGSTGRRLLVPADRTALEVLREHGLDVPSSCEQGVCGTCLTPVLEGEPDHRDTYLTPSERARNDCFTPCCSRSLTPVLVLGL